MRLTIEPTREIVWIGGIGGEMSAPARVWQGVTERGVKVQCLITRIAVDKTSDQSEFEAELAEQPAPRTGERAFPLRMIL